MIREIARYASIYGKWKIHYREGLTQVSPADTGYINPWSLGREKYKLFMYHVSATRTQGSRVRFLLIATNNMLSSAADASWSDGTCQKLNCIQGLSVKIITMTIM